MSLAKRFWFSPGGVSLWQSSDRGTTRRRENDHQNTQHNSGRSTGCGIHSGSILYHALTSIGTHDTVRCAHEQGWRGNRVIVYQSIIFAQQTKSFRIRGSFIQVCYYPAEPENDIVQAYIWSPKSTNKIATFGGDFYPTLYGPASVAGGNTLVQQCHIVTRSAGWRERHRETEKNISGVISKKNFWMISKLYFPIQT